MAKEKKKNRKKEKKRRGLARPPLSFLSLSRSPFFFFFFARDCFLFFFLSFSEVDPDSPLQRSYLVYFSRPGAARALFLRCETLARRVGTAFRRQFALTVFAASAASRRLWRRRRRRRHRNAADSRNRRIPFGSAGPASRRAAARRQGAGPHSLSQPRAKIKD